jgi:hypothetical protein
MKRVQLCVDRPIAVASLLLSLCLISFTHAAPALAKSEWVFEILHIGSGSYRYYVTDDAIKLENTGNGGISVCKAPTWKMSCFRDSDKLEFITDLKNFDKSLILSILPNHVPFAPVTPKLMQVEKLKGLSCNKILLPDRCIYWTPRDIKTAPQVSEAVARYFNTAFIPAMPIRILRPAVKLTPAQLKADVEKRKKSAVPWLNFRSMQRNDNERVTVELKSWKQVPYKASDFEYPVGYKRTKDLKDVIIPSAFRNDLIDLAKDFTDAEASKSKKSSGK